MNNNAYTKTIIDELINDDDFIERLREIVQEYREATPEEVEIWGKFLKRTNPIEKNFARELAELFQEQRNEMLSRMGERKSAIDDEIDEWIYDREKWERRFMREGKPHIMIATMNSGQAAAQDLIASGYPSGGFDISQPKVLDFFEKQSARYAKEVGETTEQLVRETLKTGMKEGESIIQLRERVHSVFGFSEKFRNERIARTEITGAANFGTNEMWKQSKVVEMKQWLAAMDARVRDSHRAISGEEVKLDELFSNSCEFPGDASSGADLSEICNCRCTMLAVFEK